MGDLTKDFSCHELATANGEFNMDIRQLLVLQAFRSWHGSPLYVSSGCRRTIKGNSAHNIYLKDKDLSFDPPLITIPATGTDIYNPNLSTWELMDKVEEWVEEIEDGKSDFILKYHNPDGIDILLDMHYPIFSGRGVYPDTNNQCIHLDCGHLSLNPEVRKKRTNPDGSIKVVRWSRWKGVYYYGNSFAELRERWEAMRND